MRSAVYRSAICCIMMLWDAGGYAQTLFRHPQPGDIYREYSRTMMTYADWRVTDPATGNPAAMANLPNKTLSITIGDLQGAVRAEAVIDLWQGHPGTTGKKIRFNDNAWIPISNLKSPPTSGECYHGQYNVVVDIPLSHLVQGTNTFQGTNGGQTCYSFDWGQHGMNGIIVRVYYNSSKPHPTGSITSPQAGQTFDENPTITATASGPAAISAVDFLAYYEGLDRDGDGIYRDWHYNYHRTRTETAMQIKGHVGTATASPYSVTWTTDQVPDQPAGSVRLLARIRDANGIWFVTDEVANLSIRRTGKAVRLYKPTGVGERFSVRAGRTTKSCTFSIPPADRVVDAVQAKMMISSFNGVDGGASPGSTHSTRLNTWEAPLYGDDHFYSLDILSPPTSALVNGTNTVTFFCNDSLTGVEIQWPGPLLLVTYVGTYASPQPPSPQLAEPGDGQEDVEPPAILRWQLSPGATSYGVQVSVDSLFTATVFDDSTVTDTSAVVAGLLYETRHYWRVRAKNSAGTSAYSPAWSFVTAARSPELVAPPDGSENLPLPVQCQWMPQAGALAYWLQVSEDSLFSGPLAVNDSTVLSTSRDVNGLPGGTRHFWRVRSRKVTGPGEFSAPWSFSTALPLPEQVTLVSPETLAVIHADSVRLVWAGGGPSVTRYWLEIGFDPNFSFRVVDSTLSDTSKIVRNLIAGNLYSWKVRAFNVTGWGPFSQVRQFQLVFVDVATETEVPREYSLSQNYPNPFNPTTEIAYGLPRESRVVLEVFNMIGQRVSVIDAGVRAAGVHRVTFDANSLPGGVYLCRLTAEGHILTRKMMLIK